MFCSPFVLNDPILEQLEIGMIYEYCFKEFFHTLSNWVTKDYY